MTVETYIGDGVYATFRDSDGAVWLDCRAQPGLSSGPSGTPSICLEPQVLQDVVRFQNKCVMECLEAAAKEREEARRLKYT